MTKVYLIWNVELNYIVEITTSYKLALKAKKYYENKIGKGNYKYIIEKRNALSSSYKTIFEI